jgi:hypothetical protein
VPYSQAAIPVRGWPRYSEAVRNKQFECSCPQRLAAVPMNMEPKWSWSMASGNRYNTVLMLGGKVDFTAANHFHDSATKNCQLYLAEVSIP